MTRLIKSKDGRGGKEIEVNYKLDSGGEFRYYEARFFKQIKIREVILMTIKKTQILTLAFLMIVVAVGCQ